MKGDCHSDKPALRCVLLASHGNELELPRVMHKQMLVECETLFATTLRR